MRIKMLKTCATTGRLLKKGDEVEVPKDLGDMMVADGNAKDVTPKPAEAPAAAGGAGAAAKKGGGAS